MDTRTEVDVRPQPHVSRIAATALQKNKRGASPPGEMADPKWQAAWSEAPTAEERVSMDPMRPTDRYRLVMPYVLKV